MGETKAVPTVGYPKVQVDDYRLLKALGFDPAKAAEIVIDANRGDKHALFFIDRARAEGRTP